MCSSSAESDYMFFAALGVTFCAFVPREVDCLQQRSWGVVLSILRSLAEKVFLWLSYKRARNLPAACASTSRLAGNRNAEDCGCDTSAGRAKKGFPAWGF